MNQKGKWICLQRRCNRRSTKPCSCINNCILGIVGTSQWQVSLQNFFKNGGTAVELHRYRPVSYDPLFGGHKEFTLSVHTDFNIPYVSDVIHKRINKHYNNLETHPNPLLQPLLQPINTRRLKICRPLDLQDTRGDIAG